MKKNKKIHHARRIISLFIILCMVISFAPTIAFADGGVSSVQIEVKNAQNGKTQYKVNNGNWIDLNESKQYDVAEINNNDQITLRAIPNEGQTLDTFGTQFWVNGKQEPINHNTLQTDAGWSFTCNEGDKYQICVEYRNGDNNPDGGNASETHTVDFGNGSWTVGEQTVTSDKTGTINALEMDAQIILTGFNADTMLAQLVADDGFTTTLTVVDGKTSLSAKNCDGLPNGTLHFSVVARSNGGQEGDNNDPEPEPDWYTISWSGGNVTVENGEVLAERVHVAQHDGEPAKTYTVIKSEYAANENDTIYSLWDTIGASKDELGGEDALQKFGLSFSQSDLFIAKGMSGVSIDFKFIPKYGYQLKNIYTNEEQTESFLNKFTTDDDNISTFTFNVSEVNQNTHFCVYFEAVSDTIDVTAESVTDASITNGENATDSGSLKMTVADIDKDVVSEELKKQVGQSAENVLYLDMNLYQIVSKGGENGNWENQLTDLNDAITVTLRVPAPVDGNSYYIVREHGENADKTYSRIDVTFVPDKNDPTMGTVTFETDKFSSYALAQAQLMSDPIDNSEKIKDPTITTDSWTAALPTDASSATAVKLIVEDNTTATDEVKSALATAAGVTPKADKSFYLDIDLKATVEGSDIPVTNLNQPVTITITVPAISPQEKYTVVRQHIDNSGNVSYEKLDSTFDRETNQLQFQTDKFSVYAVLVSAETNNPAGGTHTHTLTLVSAKDSTCTEAGNKAYYTCTGCDKWFEDAAGSVEITDHNSVVLPAKGHTVSDWKSDANSHWKECTAAGCGVIIEGSKAAHSYGNDNVCDTCGYTKPVTSTSYSIINGVNSSWTKNTNGTLTFRANGDFSKFTGVKIDGTLIDARNYTATSGSTVITLKADYLKTLSVGTHKLTVVYTDGECSTNFEVKKAASEQTKTTAGNKTNTTIPKTGDNSNLLLWMTLLFVSSFGILGTTVYGKKKRVK